MVAPYPHLEIWKFFDSNEISLMFLRPYSGLQSKGGLVPCDLHLRNTNATVSRKGGTTMGEHGEGACPRA